MSTTRLKKVLLTLDEEDHAKFVELFGRTIGVSKAVRQLMASFLRRHEVNKEKLLVKGEN